VTIEEKILLYVSRKKIVPGFELPNKIFWNGLERIKINSCAQVNARKMVREGKLHNAYSQINNKGPMLVLYYLGDLNGS